MKRIGNLYEKVYDMDNLRLAHKNARKGKGWYEEVKKIDENPDEYLKKIQEMLINRTYHTSKYQIFYKDEGYKIRKIYKLPYYPDRIVHWALLQVIEPYILRHLIMDTYSAIPSKGIHMGLKRLQDAMWKDKENCTYCLKLDVRHYYQSINHDILMQKYKRLFKDKEVLNLLDEIVNSINTAEDEDLQNIYTDEPIDINTGVPIGNYLSQYSGNYYLSDFDHWIKEVQKVKYYFRYMDDIVIFGTDKKQLRTLLNEIRIYFHTNLKLMLKSNWQIFPTYKRGIDFLGYRTFENYTLLRKRTCKKLKSKLIEIRKKVSHDSNLMNLSDYCAIGSYMGWLKYCDSYRLYRKYIMPLLPHRNKYHDTCIKEKDKMKNAVVVDANDIKAILSKHFNVPEENIIKSQYSFTVILENKEEEKK